MNDIKSRVDELAQELLNAKKLENDARLKRLEIEDEIIQLIGEQEEGTITVKGEKYKLQTKGVVSRNIDNSKLKEQLDFLPQEIKNTLVTKYEINTKEFRKIQINKDYMKTMSYFMTVKRSKTSVTAEMLNVEKGK